MRFDAALAAQEAFQRAQVELGPDWHQAVELEELFSSNAGAPARRAYESLLTIAGHHPSASSYHAFCIYITWQQAAEETVPRHFHTGMKLCESYLANRDGKDALDVERVVDLYASFRAGLGLDEENEIEAEYRRDTPKGGD
ncbi:MAG TPA: hypothetical protein VFS39_09085 [Nitrospira sp.]|nr:hypothetical protein [Nitrospira sp.]